jgi:hypothetical protein
MLPHTLFDTLGHSFLLKPLLIEEKAMEHYGLRDGYGYTFVLPRDEFRSLRSTTQQELVPTAYGDAGIQIGDYTFYESQFGFSYFHLERDAVDRQDYLLAHPGFLLFLSTLRLIQEPEHHQTRVDFLLLMYQFGVLPLEVQPSLPAENEPSQKSEDLDATFQDVREITVTRLLPEVQMVLLEHTCIIDERGHGHIRVIFPARTQRQLLLPATAIERYRIVFSDGLELRHEIDRAREMSLLAIVR